MGDLTTKVRHAGEGVAIVDLMGDITAGSEGPLVEAHTEAGDVRALVLNFGGLEYMNSGGIGLLVTMLVRAKRQGQKMLAFGLSDHYREIFSLTRLDEAITIHDDEQHAVGAAR